ASSSAATSPETGAICSSSSCHAPCACSVETKNDVRTSSVISIGLVRRKYAVSSDCVGSCDEVMSPSCQILDALVSCRTAVFRVSPSSVVKNAYGQEIGRAHV